QLATGRGGRRCWHLSCLDFKSRGCKYAGRPKRWANLRHRQRFFDAATAVSIAAIALSTISSSSCRPVHPGEMTPTIGRNAGSVAKIIGQQAFVKIQAQAANL